MKVKMEHLISTEYMRDVISRCVKEDGGFGNDVTTNSVSNSNQVREFAINIRGNGTIAGLEPISRGVESFGELELKMLAKDGDTVKDANIAIVKGPVQDILFAERTILNILGHASGIATQTKLFVDAVAGTDCKICDTRKTTPGLRLLDKYAVICGGGTSHRLGLHDAALYKDNHLIGFNNLEKDLGDAIRRAKAEINLKFIEVEVDTLSQLEKVLALPVDIALLDNMSIEQLTKAVKMRDEAQTSMLLEASGGVHLETVGAISKTGVDRISIGGVVHQATWIDVGLDACGA